MRAVLMLCAMACAAPAAAEDRQAPAEKVERAPFSERGTPPDRPPCGDRIQQVRAERGLPDLDPTAEEQPLLIAAVDHRVGGCHAIVMYRDTRDIRPVPAERRPARVRRIQ